MKTIKRSDIYPINFECECLNCNKDTHVADYEYYGDDKKITCSVCGDSLKIIDDKNEYTEGVCEDGAVILKNGERMQISEILYLLNEYNKAEREARQLATILHKNYYANESPDFELLDTVAGIITQIDNMTTSLKRGNNERSRDYKYGESTQKPMAGA